MSFIFVKNICTTYLGQNKNSTKYISKCKSSMFYKVFTNVNKLIFNFHKYKIKAKPSDVGYVTKQDSKLKIVATMTVHIANTMTIKICR